MRIERADPNADKGWLAGRWNSELDFSIGYANTGVNEPHAHVEVTEIYLVARGTAEMRIERQTIVLRPGDMLVVHPGEAHTFIASSPDYFHFVLQAPGLPGDKVPILPERLGL
jgi:quercetin dioxygenase-like cupin family protein